MRCAPAGITHPGPVVRAGIDAGEVIWRAPLFAWGAGVNPLALLWADAIQRVLVCRERDWRCDGHGAVRRPRARRGGGDAMKDTLPGEVNKKGAGSAR